MGGPHVVTVKARSAGLIGLRSVPIEIRASLDAPSASPPVLEIKGLPDAMARESAVRVLASLATHNPHLGGVVRLPSTVRIAVIDPEASRSPCDLAIACAVLAVLGIVPPASLADTLLIGDLAFDGSLRATLGVLPRLLGRTTTHAIVPHPNANEAGLGNAPYVASRLADVVEHLTGARTLPIAAPPVMGAATGNGWSSGHGYWGNSSSVEAEADKIIATGKRRILLLGPPGSGKTVLARCIGARLPPLEPEAALENVCIRSGAGLVEDGGSGSWLCRPFRAPHHSVSEAGLLGGGDRARPGEVSLANHGVLLLDEICEFRKTALRALSGALLMGSVSIARKGALVTLPAAPALVIATMARCPCGYQGSKRIVCRCPSPVLERYTARMAEIVASFDLIWEAPQ